MAMRDEERGPLPPDDDKEAPPSGQVEAGDEAQADEVDEVDDSPGPGPQTAASKAFRARIITDRKTVAQVAKVLGAWGVPAHEIDDVVPEVQEIAYRARNLPEDADHAARKYINGIARKHAQKRANARKRQIETTSLGDLPASTPAKEGASHEDRDLVHKATARAMEKNPRKVELYLRSEVRGESKAELATEAGLSGGRMRSYVGEGRKTMRGEIKALLGALGAVLLVVGFVSVWNKRDEGNSTHPPPSPSELREHARKECAASHWKACADDLHEANDLDPRGETPELRKLRLSAEQHLRETPQ